MNIYLQKVKTSALIVLATLIYTVIPFATIEVVQFLETSDPIDYKSILILAIGVCSPWITNSARQLRDYLTSQEEANT